MYDFIKLLDKNIEYVSHQIIDDNCYISVSSNRIWVRFPYCWQMSTKIHSKYERTFQNLPNI